MQGVSESEVRELAVAHKQPLRLYSHGVTISRLHFTFLKMEGRNVVLLRRSDAKCAVGFANTGANKRKRFVFAVKYGMKVADICKSRTGNKRKISRLREKQSL